METPDDRAQPTSPDGPVPPRQDDVGPTEPVDGSGLDHQEAASSAAPLSPDDRTSEHVADDLPRAEDTDRPKLDEANSSPRSKRLWEGAKPYVAVAAGAAGAAVVATLAATHRTAQRENLVAYMNGRSDAENTDYMAVISDLQDRIDELEEDG
jgi:hypothetical protein